MLMGWLSTAQERLALFGGDGAYQSLHFDTPHRLKPDGFAGHASGNPLRSLLKSLSGPA